MSSDERWTQLRKEVWRMHPDYRLVLEKLEKIPVETDFTVANLGGGTTSGTGVVPVIQAAIALKIVAKTGEKRGRLLVYRRMR